MPKVWIFLVKSFLTFTIVAVAIVGSPGPLEMTTARILDFIFKGSVFQGMTTTFNPLAANRLAMFALAPQSMRATVFWPLPTTYGFLVETSATRLRRLGSSNSVQRA